MMSKTSIDGRLKWNPSQKHDLLFWEARLERDRSEKPEAGYTVDMKVERNES